MSTTPPPRRRSELGRGPGCASVARPRGEGDGDWRAFRAKTDDQDAAQLEMARAWQRTKFDAGWAAPHWPREFGGQGLSGIEAGVVAEEEARFDVAANFFVVGIDLAGPTLMAHGTPEQQKRFLEPMLRGDESWCQLFSEPGSGSDLASLSTRAERDGDEWVLTGRRCGPRRPTRPTGASAWPARTPTSPSTPASPTSSSTCTRRVDVRPLRQIDGAIHFNEVFLDGVRVPARPRRRRRRRRLAGGDDDAHRRAHLDRRGWPDRLARGRRPGPAVRPRPGAAACARRSPELATREMIQRWLVYRVRTATAKGVPPGPGGVGAQAGQQPPGGARWAP